MVPCFALMASIGLWVERDFASDIETQDLAQRVGSLAGKIAISMNRHDAANQPQLAQDLLAPLGHEPSVVCAKYQAGGQLVARYPQGLGCRNAVFDDSIDLALGPETFFRVALTEDNWQALVHAQLRNSMISQAAAFVVALIAASIGFQILVSRRLARLNQAIRRADLTGLRVLLAEDDLLIRTLTHQTLGRAGAQVEVAENGTVALEKFGHGQFDLVLTDIMMPELDGFGLTCAIRQQDKRTPIIALTAAVLGEETDRIQNLGATAVLSKPIDLNRLMETLQELGIRSAA